MNTNQFSSQSFGLQACSLDDQAGQRERKRINRKNEFLQNPLAINYILDRELAIIESRDLISIEKKKLGKGNKKLCITKTTGVLN